MLRNKKEWEYLARKAIAVLTRIAVALEKPPMDYAGALAQLKKNNRKIKEAQKKYDTQKKEEVQKK